METEKEKGPEKDAKETAAAAADQETLSRSQREDELQDLARQSGALGADGVISELFA